MGNSIELVGYSVSSHTPSSVKIEMVWRTINPVEQDLTMFLQLLDNDNQGSSARLINNRWADISTLRRAGEPVILLPVNSSLPVTPDQLQGNRLITGMYDFTTGQRMPVEGSSDGTILLQTIKDD